MTDNVPLRLGLYGAGLALAFVAALGGGAAVGPVGPAVPAAEDPGHAETPTGTTTDDGDDNEPSGGH